jgi:hypothetical protein
MILIVTGSRTFVSKLTSYNKQEWLRDMKYIWDRLSWHHSRAPISLLVEGGAKGADSLANQWAKKNNIPVDTVNAEWDTHGKAAGMIRNRKMLDKHPEAHLIGFPVGESRGTRGCISEALKRKMSVTVYEGVNVKGYDFFRSEQGKLF